jgi:peroxiredoxin Q/BCP
MHHLKEGDKAPPFKGKDQNGNETSLASLKGKKVVLYFYPRDNTPTCTEEACNFRDNYQSLLKQGFQVIGVSNDDEKSHGKFIKKFNLPFPLIADTDMKIVNDYGIYGEKLFMGRTIIGIHRTTFVIDEKGYIQTIISKVKSKNATEQLLETLKESA